jgi:hypothetical protein
MGVDAGIIPSIKTLIGARECTAPTWHVKRRMAGVMRFMCPGVGDGGD